VRQELWVLADSVRAVSGWSPPGKPPPRPGGSVGPGVRAAPKLLRRQPSLPLAISTGGQPADPRVGEQQRSRPDKTPEVGLRGLAGPVSPLTGSASLFYRPKTLLRSSARVDDEQRRPARELRSWIRREETDPV